MAYQENKPLATDRLKDSQADIQANFQSNKTAFDQNHVTFDDANAGKHKFLQMPEQGAAPTTAANEMGLYTKVQGGVSQMFIRRESDGDEINVTNDVLKAADGYTRLPNGLIIKWGTKSIGRNTLSAELAFDTTVEFSAVYTVNVSQTFTAAPTTGDLNVAVSAGDVTITGFKAFARRIGLDSGAAVSIYYVAIGV